MWVLIFIVLVTGQGPDHLDVSAKNLFRSESACTQAGTNWYNEQTGNSSWLCQKVEVGT